MASHYVVDKHLVILLVKLAALIVDDLRLANNISPAIDDW